MITVRNRTTTSGRAVDHLSCAVHPGPLCGPVVVTVPSSVAEGCGLWLLTRARRTRTA